jgi:hypothetical protein
LVIPHVYGFTIVNITIPRCNIESGENLVKCNEPEPVDMHEVNNESMNEMSESYDESEETSNPIAERLAKTINTSLRANISESKLKEIKSKFKRPHNCQKSNDSHSKRGSVDKRHPQLNAIRTRDLRLLKVMGYMIKGMTPIIETTNYILKVALKKESFEPAKNLRQSSKVSSTYCIELGMPFVHTTSFTVGIIRFLTIVWPFEFLLNFFEL